MNNLNVICGKISAQDIIINKNELAQRLRIERGFEHSVIDLCVEEFNSVVNYRYAYRCVPVKFLGENVCNIGFGNIYSKNLYDILQGSSFAIILAVTTGIGVDRLLNKYSVTSASRHFIMDAIASAAAESFCDYMDNMLRNNPFKKPRFSPGYGDLSLEIQPDLLGALNATKNLGTTINKSLLMTPVKSITAVMGVYDE